MFCCFGTRAHSNWRETWPLQTTLALDFGRGMRDPSISTIYRESVLSRPPPDTPNLQRRPSPTLNSVASRTAPSLVRPLCHRWRERGLQILVGTGTPRPSRDRDAAAPPNGNVRERRSRPPGDTHTECARPASHALPERAGARAQGTGTQSKGAGQLWRARVEAGTDGAPPGGPQARSCASESSRGPPPRVTLLCRYWPHGALDCRQAVLGTPGPVSPAVPPRATTVQSLARAPPQAS